MSKHPIPKNFASSKRSSTGKGTSSLSRLKTPIKFILWLRAWSSKFLEHWIRKPLLVELFYSLWRKWKKFIKTSFPWGSPSRTRGKFWRLHINSRRKIHFITIILSLWTRNSRSVLTRTQLQMRTPAIILNTKRKSQSCLKNQWKLSLGTWAMRWK